MSFKVFVKVAGKSGRITLDSVDFQEKVEFLRERFSQRTEIPSKDLNLVYCGRILRDDDTLETVGVKPGCTVHALRKRIPDPEPELEPMDDVAIKQLMTALHAALLNPGHRQAVHNILTSAETIDNIIAATPGMSADHIAVSMLRDPQLLVQVADPENVKRIVRAHPAIGHAVMNIAASVNEEAALRFRSGAGTSGTSSHDPAFDVFMPELGLDEDMETPGESSRGENSRSQSGITAAQLTAALSAAGVGGGAADSGVPSSRGLARGFLRPYDTPVSRFANNQSEDSPQQNNSSRSAQGQITSDVFQQALAQAMQSAGNFPSTPAEEGSSNSSGARVQDFSDQLVQLRNMGITDESQCMRALQATDGDVEAALNLIFEGDI